MRHVASWVGLVLVLIVGAEIAKAAAAPTELQTPPTPSGWVIFEKLGRGLGNVAFGWTEIPGTIQQQYREHDAPSSFFSGLFIGFAKAIGRTAVGAYETVTFVIPQGPILPPLTYFKRDHPDWKLPSS